MHVDAMIAVTQVKMNKISGTAAWFNNNTNAGKKGM